MKVTYRVIKPCKIFGNLTVAYPFIKVYENIVGRR